jgi:glycosidase
VGSDWLADAVMYQICPQSFADSDGDGIGDLRGVIERLDHIASLGVDTVWFNPCFTSPFFDAGYDVSDYLTIAPRHGTDDDLVELVAAAKALGIRDPAVARRHPPGRRPGSRGLGASHRRAPGLRRRLLPGDPPGAREGWARARQADPRRPVILSTADHDFNRLACGPRTAEQLGAALTFLFTWGTVPCLYYGDEIGMRYLPGLPDVEGSVCHPAYNRSGRRTPMQWDDGPNAGFSTTDASLLYLPIDGRTVQAGTAQADGFGYAVLVLRSARRAGSGR